MERSFADELYPQVLQPQTELGHTPVRHNLQDGNEEVSWCEDATSWDDAIKDLDGASDLDREWQKRRNQFHTVGYRDGLMAGKEASAQEGFNVGFNESVFVGYNWGIVRGVTSALACLPDGLKEKMVETQERRNKFNQLYESVNSLSTTDALKLFHDNLSNKIVEQSDNVGSSSPRLNSCSQNSGGSHLSHYYREFQTLISDSPAVKVNLKMDQ